MEQSTPRPPRREMASPSPYLRALTPEGKWTCPSAVCQFPGLCGKMDPPARRRVGSWRLTRLLLGIRLSPGRQENQHTERAGFFFPDPYLNATQQLGLRTQASPPWQVVAPESSRIRARAKPPSDNEATGQSSSGLCGRLYLSFSG